MSISEEQRARLPYILGSRKNLDSSLFEPETRPQDLKDKQGKRGTAVFNYLRTFVLDAILAVS